MGKNNCRSIRTVWGIGYSMHMTSGPTSSCMASSPITSWKINGETMETMRDFIFLGPQITVDGDCSHEIERLLLLGRKTMTNLSTEQ